MDEFKIKDAFKNVIIGFNNSSLPLGQRTDLDILYRQAKSRNYKPHLDLFETAPSDSEIADNKAKDFLKKQEDKKNPQ